MSVPTGDTLTCEDVAVIAPVVQTLSLLSAKVHKTEWGGGHTSLSVVQLDYVGIRGVQACINYNSYIPQFQVNTS